MNKRKIKISILANSIILALTIIAFIIAPFVDFDRSPVELTFGRMFTYFTTLSNVFLFIGATITITYNSLYLNKRVKKLPKWSNIFKLCATTSTTITFLIVLFFLLPLTASSNNPDFPSPVFLFTGSNLIFHLFNPLIGLSTLLLFEETKEIKWWDQFYSLIFVGLYEIFYVMDMYIKFIPYGQHDWYHFAKVGDFMVPIVVILFLAGTYGLSYLLCFINRKIHLWEKAA